MVPSAKIEEVIPMAFTEQDKQAMDNAATDAENDLPFEGEPTEEHQELIDWWHRWYMKTGHKRLARILLQYAKKE